jgi:hypothetical protein
MLSTYVGINPVHPIAYRSTFNMPTVGLGFDAPSYNLEGSHAFYYNIWTTSR